MAKDAHQIGRRFREEHEHIERYVRLLRARSTLHDRQVQDLNLILERAGIPSLPRRSYDRLRQPYSQDEVRALLKSIRKVEPEIYQTILGHEQRLDDIPSMPSEGPAADYLNRFNEWVDYLVDRLSDDPGDQDIENAIHTAVEEAKTVDEDLDEEDRIPPDALRALLRVAAEHALHVRIAQRLDSMVYARQQFEEIEVLARMAEPDAEINVLRQGFVLLMTAFDAAVFDLARLALQRRFFELIGAFGRQDKDKFTLQALSDAGNFEVFKEQVIEDQLKKRYVKDLLGLLEGHGIGLVDENSGDRAVQLIELVLRRNLHVHSRGVVDARYLELDQTSGKPKYNLFDLKLGQVAAIDDDYFRTAMRLCKHCVDRLVVWACS